MSEPKPTHKPHGDPHGGSNHPGGRPYWQRAHRDWRLWIVVVLMLAAMAIYLMTNDLAGWQHPQPRQPML